MNFDEKFLDGLTRQAEESPRRRMNFDLRDSEADLSQKMLNALEPDTVLPIHRHNSCSESVVMLRGSAIQYLYDEAGCQTEAVWLAASAESAINPPSGVTTGPCAGMVIPRGQWHRIVSLQHGTVLIEAKEGPYHPLAPDEIM